LAGAMMADEARHPIALTTSGTATRKLDEEFRKEETVGGEEERIEKEEQVLPWPWDRVKSELKDEKNKKEEVAGERPEEMTKNKNTTKNREERRIVLEIRSRRRSRQVPTSASQQIGQQRQVRYGSAEQQVAMPVSTMLNFDTKNSRMVNFDTKNSRSRENSNNQGQQGQGSQSYERWAANVVNTNTSQPTFGSDFTYPNHE